MRHFTSEKGFAAILVVSLLPCLLAGLFLVAVLMSFMQTDLELKHHCRSGGLSGQASVRPLLMSLLALNPVATTLKIQETAVLAKLAVAVSSGNVPAITTLKAQLAKIRQKRQELDLRQKQLIQQSNLLLARNHGSTAFDIRSRAQNLKTQFFFLNLSLRVLHEEAPRLAVHPDSSDVAPTYSPEESFETRQALAHRWQYRLTPRGPLAYFLAGSFQFDKACAVTLTKDARGWKTLITKGKYSLKSVW
ncbi:hypothetical protein EZJ49_14865 [Bdellovibrio bacteriovorus]|uniref:hypothetical protein n=1 Tax=Bdellovibrio bacteriovorus TaxID=959 RepID=UPI0021D12EB2|nr:hypothetical protein [Bdellovibrio bacteriovorus]UXR64348.1 hypothetical protein EZJ49_14865 [Bdellovibrio bacteriovorus]